MKKIIALLVIFSLILTGCAGVTDSGNKSDDDGDRTDIKAGAALVLDRYCHALGGKYSLQEILNALKFKLTVETILDIPGYLIL